MAKILLVDDEVTMVQMVTELFRSEGHEVFPFTNCNAATEALETISPELVITDLYLDKTRAHGLEILHKARSLNPPPRGHCHDGLRINRDSGRGDEGRGLRLPGETIQA